MGFALGATCWNTWSQSILLNIWTFEHLYSVHIFNSWPCARQFFNIAKDESLSLIQRGLNLKISFFAKSHSVFIGISYKILVQFHELPLAPRQHISQLYPQQNPYKFYISRFCVNSLLPQCFAGTFYSNFATDSGNTTHEGRNTRRQGKRI